MRSTRFVLISFAIILCPELSLGLAEGVLGMYVGGERWITVPATEGFELTLIGGYI